jgi:hypothetical protein
MTITSNGSRRLRNSLPAIRRCGSGSLRAAKKLAWWQF